MPVILLSSTSQMDADLKAFIRTLFPSFESGRSQKERTCTSQGGKCNIHIWSISPVTPSLSSTAAEQDTRQHVAGNYYSLLGIPRSSPAASGRECAILRKGRRREIFKRRRRFFAEAEQPFLFHWVRLIFRWRALAGVIPEVLHFTLFSFFYPLRASSN